MARCGCSTDCLCTVTGGCGVTVTGSGSVAAPYTVAADLSADTGNLLECRADGLYASGGVSVADTSCIDLAGAGSLASPLTASPVISSDASNVLECRANGLYAPAASAPASRYYAILRDNGGSPTVLPATALQNGSSAIIQYDTNQASSDLSVFLLTGPAYTSTYIEIPAGGGGLYHVGMIKQGWGPGPNATGDLLLRASIVLNGPATPAGSDSIAQSATYVVRATSVANNIPMLHVSVLFPLVAGDRLRFRFSAEPWAGAGFAGASLFSTQPSKAIAWAQRVGV
jgi:hypothetical protein